MTANPNPRRGEIWTAYLEDHSQRHWVVIVSLDNRNLSDRASSVLVVPFGSYGMRGPTVAEFQPGECGLPSVSYLKAHFIQVLHKSKLIERQRRNLSSTRMKELVQMIGRAVDPDADWAGA
ncbi:MAG: type II toxin-antitoxin system PemK/MazF family toxin [Terriglobales bacterium]